jgi:hypothetical protein
VGREMKEIRAIIRLYKQIKKISKDRKKAVKQEPTDKGVEVSINSQSEEPCKCGKERGSWEQCFDCHQEKKEKEKIELMSPEFWKKVNSIGAKDNCPYCMRKLSKIPERKMKCEFCKEYIFPKTRPDRIRVIVKDRERKLIDDLYSEFMDAKYLRDYGFIPKKDQDKLAISTMRNSGFNAEDYTKMKEQLKKQFGHDPSPRDVVWGIFNRKIMESKSYQEIKYIYNNMARFLFEEGKDHYNLLKKSNECNLLHFKKTKLIAKVIIDAIPNSCKECQKLNGNIYTIKEALEKMPIPCKECNHDNNEGGFGWCRCMWQPHFEDLEEIKND